MPGSPARTQVSTGSTRALRSSCRDWFDRFRDASFLPHIGVVILLFVDRVAGAPHPEARLKPTLDPRLVMVATCLLTIVIVLVLFASQPNTEPRYLLGLVPCIAIVSRSSSTHRALASSWWPLRSSSQSSSALAQLQSFGQKPISSISDPRLVAPVSETRVREGTQPMSSTQTCTPDTAGKINMVGADYPWFNHNTLEMLAFERYRGKRPSLLLHRARVCRERTRRLHGRA